MLATRLATGLTLVAVLLAVLIFDEWLAPWFPLWFVTSMVVMILCALELVGLAQSTTNARPSRTRWLAATIALVLANWAPHLVRTTGSVDPLRCRSRTFDPLAMRRGDGLAALDVRGDPDGDVPLAELQFRRPGRRWRPSPARSWRWPTSASWAAFIIQMRWFDGPYHGLIPLATLVATAKGSDTGAYTMGRIAGRHKLWPRLSPNKTVEGAIGGLAFGVLAR